MARRVANLVVVLAAAAAAKCEVLRSLEFQQHTAPKGVSELLGPVASIERERDEVVRIFAALRLPNPAIELVEEPARRGIARHAVAQGKIGCRERFDARGRHPDGSKVVSQPLEQQVRAGPRRQMNGKLRLSTGQSAGPDP